MLHVPKPYRTSPLPKTSVESARVFAAALRALKRMKELSGVLGLLSKTRIEYYILLYPYNRYVM